MTYSFDRKIALFAGALFAAALPVTAMAAHARSATIIDNGGAEIGMVTLRAASGGVLLRIKVEGLPPGPHGMHFHAVGDCSPHATFDHAGAHIDPDRRPHGYLHPQGPHEGNLPNLIVHADGTADVELYTSLVRLEEGPAALFDADGSALIIHADPDDHLTQPIGGSGARIACAAFTR